MKLERNIRVKGRIHGKYDVSKTPYKKIIESDQVNAETKERLKEAYDGLTHAELKRNIDRYGVYRKKNGSKTTATDKKLTASTVSFI